MTESTRPAVGAFDRRGQNKCAICEVRAWAVPNNSKHTEASFHRFRQIRCAQMSISPDLAIFVLTTTDKTLYNLRMRAGRN